LNDGGWPRGMRGAASLAVAKGAGFDFAAIPSSAERKPQVWIYFAARPPRPGARTESEEENQRCVVGGAKRESEIGT
jgi:hypothetical protein